MDIKTGNTGFPLTFIETITGGMLKKSCDAEVTGISIDSRKINPGDLFVAIRGERFDGHDYIDSAFEAGAACVIVDHIPSSARCEGNVIVVQNTVEALGKIASVYKEKIAPLTVAVTGSVGKTTTKQFIYSVLSREYRTHKTEGNFNNEIGLPLTLLSMNSDTEAAVLEMGMSARGEIEYLSNLAKPDIAVITCIGTAHIERLGSRENIRDAKLEIRSGLRSGGKLVLNGDEPLLSGIDGAIYVAMTDPDADYVVSEIVEGYRESEFKITVKGGKTYKISIPAVGTHIVFDAALAFAVGDILGIDPEEIILGLKAYKTTGMRQNIVTVDGITYINDYYNASPESMKASLKVLGDMARKNGGRAVAVLGDMKELGNFSAPLHEEIGAAAYEAGVDLLFTFGPLASSIADGAEKAGMSAGAIFRCPDLSSAESLGNAVAAAISLSDTVLFKASRAVAMERVTEYVCKEISH